MVAASDAWRDPTVDHPDDGAFAGNWVGEATGWDDTWATGVSKEWGKNAGDMPSIACVDSGLYVTNGALPSDACEVGLRELGSGLHTWLALHTEWREGPTRPSSGFACRPPSSPPPNHSYFLGRFSATSVSSKMVPPG